MYIPIFKRYLKSSKLGVLRFIRQKRRKEGMVRRIRLSVCYYILIHLRPDFPRKHLTTI